MIIWMCKNSFAASTAFKSRRDLTHNVAAVAKFILLFTPTASFKPFSNIRFFPKWLLLRLDASQETLRCFVGLAQAAYKSFTLLTEACQLSVHRCSATTAR